MKVKIADLNERISIRNYVTKRNDRGDILNSVEFERCRVWAKVYALTGKNSDTPPEQTNRITYRVTIRYREGIMPNDEIEWRGRRLKLLSPPFNLDGKRIFTSFECEEMVEDEQA